MVCGPTAITFGDCSCNQPQPELEVRALFTEVIHHGLPEFDSTKTTLAAGTDAWVNRMVRARWGFNGVNDYVYADPLRGNGFLIGDKHDSGTMKIARSRNPNRYNDVADGVPLAFYDAARDLFLVRSFKVGEIIYAPVDGVPGGAAFVCRVAHSVADPSVDPGTLTELWKRVVVTGAALPFRMEPVVDVNNLPDSYTKVTSRRYLKRVALTEFSADDFATVAGYAEMVHQVNPDTGECTLVSHTSDGAGFEVGDDHVHLPRSASPSYAQYCYWDAKYLEGSIGDQIAISAPPYTPEVIFYCSMDLVSGWIEPDAGVGPGFVVTSIETTLPIYEIDYGGGIIGHFFDIPIGTIVKRVGPTETTWWICLSPFTGYPTGGSRAPGGTATGYYLFSPLHEMRVRQDPEASFVATYPQGVTAGAATVTADSVSVGSRTVTQKHYVVGIRMIAEPDRAWFELAWVTEAFKRRDTITISEIKELDYFDQAAIAHVAAFGEATEMVGYQAGTASDGTAFVTKTFAAPGYNAWFTCFCRLTFETPEETGTLAVLASEAARIVFKVRRSVRVFTFRNGVATFVTIPWTAGDPATVIPFEPQGTDLIGYRVTPV